MYKYKNAQNRKSSVAGDRGMNKICALVYNELVILLPV